MKELKKTLHHLFVPHHGNNHRSKLLHHSSLLVVLFAILSLIAVSQVVNTSAPQILGINYSISENDLLSETNRVRAENGLAPLTMNTQLANAAAGKAQHMFLHNYWAHFAPDGTSPWDFIQGAGFEYIYAGENLAKGFTGSSEIVNAWMNSPTHRENLLSPKYTQIGFAVAEGDLLDEETVLVVQMFGAGNEVLAQAPEPEEVEVVREVAVPQVTGQQVQPVATQGNPHGFTQAAIITSPTIDSDTFSKTVTLVLFSALLFALLLDIVITGKKQIPRLVGNNIDHILIVSIFIILIIVQNRGGVL